MCLPQPTGPPTKSLHGPNPVAALQVSDTLWCFGGKENLFVSHLSILSSPMMPMIASPSAELPLSLGTFPLLNWVWEKPPTGQINRHWSVQCRTYQPHMIYLSVQSRGGLPKSQVW